MRHPIQHAIWSASLGLLALATVTVTTQSIKAHAKTASTKRIDYRLKHMTTNEKLGQLFVAGVSNDSAATKRNIKNYHLGGIILMGNNFVGTKTSFKNRLKGYQNVAKTPLLISTDQEGGTVSRLSSNTRISGHSHYYSPQEAYRHGGMKKVVSIYKYQAKQLHSLGINWDFAPVADVSASKGSFIYPRTFGQGYSATAKYIGEVVPAMQRYNVAATLKHFPGYGAAADTHTGTAVVNRSLKQFESQDFLPFKAGIKAGVDSVMVTHIILKQVDPTKPASLSKKDINLLRNTLAFKGVIVSDSLQMGAVTNYVNQHHVSHDVLAVQAGNDMLISSDYKQGIPQLKRALAKNQISMTQVNASVRRILTMKEKLGLKV